MINEFKKLILFFKIQSKKKRIFFVENNFSKKNLEPYFNKNSNFQKTLVVSLNCNLQTQNINNTDVINFKNKFVIYLLFLFCNIRYCYSTTPDLGYTLFVRSITKSTKYIYIQHSQISLLKAYRFNAFKHFDVIQVCNSFQKEEVYYLENLFKKKIKAFKIRNLFLENYITDQKKTYFDILIAPTWNTNFFEDEIILNLIKILNKDYSIKIRPHYMTVLKDKNYKKNIQYFEKFLLNDNFNFYDFKILISDWSGIFLEYSLITKRKSILINTNQKINNESVNLNFPISVEEHSRKYLSNNIDKDEIEKIPELIKNYTFDKEDLVVKSYLKKYFY